MGIEGTHLNIIKVICDSPIANIKLNSEKHFFQDQEQNKSPAPHDFTDKHLEKS